MAEPTVNDKKAPRFTQTKASSETKRHFVCQPVALFGRTGIARGCKRTICLVSADEPAVLSQCERKASILKRAIHI